MYRQYIIFAGWFQATFVVVAILMFAGNGRVPAASITLDGAQQYQVIDGFGVNANHRNWTNSELQPALDALIDEAGMTIFRVVYDQPNWEGTNDNASADSMNWTYYDALYGTADFAKLWDTIAYLNQKGITHGVMLNFQGCSPGWMGGCVLGPGFENEWAEMIASLLVYARNTRHLQFNLVAPENEPDLPGQGTGVTVAQYTAMLHKLAELLDSHGLGDMRFVGPDLVMAHTNWLPELMSDPVVIGKMAHFGLHSYSGNGGRSAGVYNFLQQSACSNTTFWMTEFNVECIECERGIGPNTTWEYCRGTADYLLNDLENGSSAGLIWEGYDGYYKLVGGHWSYWGLLALDDIAAVPMTYTPRRNFFTVTQISRFVRPGAFRISVTGWTGSVPLLGFFHPATGRVTLVGINTTSMPLALSCSLTNLPTLAGLDLYYTDAGTNLCRLPRLSVTNATFTAGIPADCVFTLTGFDQSTITPRLDVALGTNGLNLSWSSWLTDFVLETTLDLVPGSGSTWLQLTNHSEQTDERSHLTLEPRAEQQFFRLRRR